jgi:hypothetical protein
MKQIEIKHQEDGFNSSPVSNIRFTW